MILFLLGIRTSINIYPKFIPKNCKSNLQMSRILLLTISSWHSWEIRMTKYRQSCMTNGMIFSFQIVNFPFLSSNIPSSPTYGVYTSQLIRYARCCSQYSDFSARHKTLVERLLSQGFKSNRLSNTFKKFYDRHNDLIGKYNVSLPNLLRHCSLLTQD